jgi:hypothetical protein
MKTKTEPFSETLENSKTMDMSKITVNCAATHRRQKYLDQAGYMTHAILCLNESQIMMETSSIYRVLF